MDPDGPTAAGRPHPRSFGCYPRLLGRFVRDEGVLDMETAITMCTARPASRAGLRDRGRLETGWAADVVVFDPDTVIDRATFRDPRQLPRGIEHVIVNGVLAVEDGRQIDDRRAGRVLAA